MTMPLDILVVDDNPADSRYLSRILKNIGNWHVTTRVAGSYHNAIQEVSASTPDIVFSDYCLGAESGIDVIRYCSKWNSNIHVILLTGFGNENVVREAFMAGVSDYISKDKITAEHVERVLRYITEKIKTKKKLKETEERYWAIFENAADSIVLIDPKTGKLLDFNKMAYMNLGYTQQEFHLKKISDIDEFHQQTGAPPLHRYGEEVEAFETRHRSKNGELRDILVKSRQITISDKRLILSIWNDITERKRSEKELQKANEDLRLGNRYKTEFLANISHELRTPLNSILLFSWLIEENREAGSREKQIEFAATIRKAGHELLELINDLLDLAKVEAGMMEPVCEAVRISDTARNLTNMFEPQALKKGISFTSTIEEDVPETMVTDGKRLYQILKNFLSNAVKFTKEGHVTLHILKHKPGNGKKPSPSGESHIVFKVSDTGIGIAEDKTTRIFEAFMQADGTIDRNYGGTGLGLSLAKEFSELLGGRIEVESEPGKGTIFSLFIPEEQTLCRKQESATPAPLPSVSQKPEPIQESAEPLVVSGDVRANLKGRKVLVIDDDMRNVFALLSVLDEYEICSVVGENGQAGLEKLTGNPDVELVFMDMMMPVMNGYDTIKEIRNHESYRKLPVIALTAKAMKEDREKCLKAGADAYISKPVDISLLISKMDRLFKQSMKN